MKIHAMSVQILQIIIVKREKSYSLVQIEPS